MIIVIFIMVVLLGFSFFFSMSEASLVATNPSLLKRLSATGDKRALMAFKLMTNRKVLFGTILLGNNIAIVAFTMLGEKTFSEGHAENWWLLLSIILFCGILLIFGEIIPKSVALEAPDHFALILSPAVAFIARLFNPLIELVHFLPSLFIKNINPEGAEKQLVSEGQIRLALIQGSQDGVVDQEERELGLKVIDFAETVVEKVMTLRGDIESLPAELSIKDAYKRIVPHGFTRVPIYANDDVDNIVGFLNVKDLLTAHIEKNHDKPLSFIKREMAFVPEKKKILDLMLDFQKEQNHIAMVIDEVGSITGLITLEDLLEEVVGEIYDEHDEPEEKIYKLGQDTFLLDGRLSVEEVNSELDVELLEEDYETIGGFVTGLFGKVPRKGQSIQHAGMNFTVVRMENRRIDQIKMKINRNGNHN
ncbi:hemolysin family protein [bacterium]|nr:hemolysin family protein [bacterium]MBU1024728.1 hemolysin family protein [bacterium]